MRTAVLLSIMVGALLGVSCERLSVPSEGDANELIVYTTLRPPNQDIYLVDRSDAEPRRMTEHLGLDYNATFSPDGRWLVFTSDRGGNTDLYALDLQEENGEPVRLTRDSAMDDAADVSPDGNRIAFVSTRGGNADVFVMPFTPDDTTAEAQAQNLTHRRGGDFNPSFSPDGSLIAWARQEARPQDGPALSPQNFRRARATEVFVMASDGSGARPTGEENLFGDEARIQMVGGSPAWSPDGTSIYFHGFSVGEQGFLAHMRDRSTRTGIWRTPLSGGPPEQVVETGATFALSPSVGLGGRIAYATGPAPPPGPAPLLWHRSGEVHSVGAHGGNARVEVDSAAVALCLAPAFHPDGRLACHGPGPTVDLPQMANGRPIPRPGTDHPIQLKDRPVRLVGIRGIFPDFLPDGRVVFGEGLNEATGLARFARDGLPPLVTSELDGASRREVFRRENSPPWAPATCDDWIAFTVGTPFAPGTEDVDVWKVRSDGTGAVNLTAGSDANDALPAWSPDCQRIFFRSFRDGNANIYAMGADGKNVRRITDEPGVETTPDVSPDGTWLALATDRGGAGMKVWIQRLDGSQGRFLEPDRRGVAGIDIHPRFSPDGAWIVLTSDRGGWADEALLSDDPQPFGDLWAVPVEDGAPVRLTDNKWEDGLAQWGIH
jgi:Tol biopolymer transport system component